MKYMLKYLAGFVLLLLVFSLFSGCRKEPHFDEVPSIEFRRLEDRVYIDDFSKAKIHEISVIVYFQDGDGNLGLSTTMPADTIHPFNFGSEFHNNFILNVLVKEPQPDGSHVFVPFKFPDSGRSDNLSGRFPRISSDTRPEPLEGEIKYTNKGINADIPGLVGKVVKFEVFIYDRALNKSNTVVSNEITLFP